jgi:hypothetical protein
MTFFATADFILLLIGLVLGALAGYFIAGLRAAQHIQELRLTAQQRQDIIDELRWESLRQPTVSREQLVVNS